MSSIPIPTRPLRAEGELTSVPDGRLETTIWPVSLDSLKDVRDVGMVVVLEAEHLCDSSGGHDLSAQVVDVLARPTD